MEYRAVSVAGLCLALVGAGSVAALQRSSPANAEYRQADQEKTKLENVIANTALPENVRLEAVSIYPAVEDRVNRVLESPDYKTYRTQQGIITVFSIAGALTFVYGLGRHMQERQDRKQK